MLVAQELFNLGNSNPGMFLIFFSISRNLDSLLYRRDERQRAEVSIERFVHFCGQGTGSG